METQRRKILDDKNVTFYANPSREILRITSDNKIIVYKNTFENTYDDLRVINALFDGLIEARDKVFFGVESVKAI